MALPVRELLHKAGDELGTKGDPSTCTGQGAAPQHLRRVAREGSWQQGPASSDKARG